MDPQTAIEATSRQAVPQALAEMLSGALKKNAEFKQVPLVRPVIRAPTNYAPLVSALMVLHDVQRLVIARHAANNFLDQTYPNKELVIINATDRVVVEQPHPWIREISVGPGATQAATVWELLSEAVKEAYGSWLVFWEPDSRYGAERIAFQMACREGRASVMLRNELCCDIEKSVVFRVEEPTGILSSLLFPKPVLAVSGITDHLGAYLVAPNTAEPASRLQTTFWSLINLHTRETFMGRYAGPEHYKHWNCTMEEANYIRGVLKDVYGFEVNPVGTTLGPSEAPVPVRTASPSIINGV